MTLLCKECSGAFECIAKTKPRMFCDQCAIKRKRASRRKTQVKATKLLTQEQRERRRAYGRAAYARNPTKYIAASRERNAKISKDPVLRLKYNATNKKWRDRIWADVLDLYHGRCFCCGETNPIFLTIDHVCNDGAIDRKRGLKSTKLYARIVSGKEDQSRFQLLCFNCNCGRARNRGLCPHQEHATPLQVLDQLVECM